MQNKISLFFIFLFCNYFSFSQKVKLQGAVVEMGTKYPLAFVSVVIKENKNGKVTDIDGKFSFLKTPNKYTLKISYVGYETKEVGLTENDTAVIIELAKESKQMETVVIGNRENPALRIIKLLIDNKKNNNPALLPSYKYNAYTISSIGIGDKFLFKQNADSSKKPKKTVSPKAKRNDSLSLVMFKNFKENYIMVTESYIERKFRFPNRNKETVLASKVSGLREAPFALTASSFQPFGFYTDFIKIGLGTFVNPAIKAGTALYDFKLKETLVNTTDTTFIIYFEPKKNKNFIGLKGLLYINSDGYAIENVIASPAEKKGVAFYFKLQQQYERIQGKWFPKQLNTNITQKTLNSDSSLLNWDSRSYITNVSIGEIFQLSLFSDIEQSFDVAKGRKTETEWKKLRTDSLSVKEKATYTTYDNLPSSTLNKLNKLNGLINVMSLQSIPWGKLDIPFKYFMDGINPYEGIRIGAGLQSNPSFSKYFSLGAFAGYGIKDKAWKYGGNIFFTVKERTATLLTLRYERNIIEPGNVGYFGNVSSPLFAQTARKFLISRMDSIKQFKLDFTTKIIPTLQANIWMQNEIRNPAGYDYLFNNKSTTQDVRIFTNTEIGIGFRYTKGESFIKVSRAKIQSKAATTQMLIEVSKGLKDVWKGTFAYTKMAFQMNHTINSKWLGQTSIQLDAGHIWGSVPYAYLFNTKASANGRKVTIYIPNSFQTVGLYEFASSQFGSLFIQNDFGNLLFKPKNILIRPSLLFIQNIGFGKLNNASAHKQINFQAPNKGLYESGILVKNIYRKSYINLFYIGLTAGAFYRYGYYHLAKESDNWAYKIGLNFSFN